MSGTHRVRLLRKQMSQSKTQETAAAKAVVAGMSVRAARKWQNGTLLSETKEERTRRTRGGATGHELVRRGRGVFYAATYQVLQDLLAAKRDLALPRELRRYDAFDLVVLDDLGYVQRSVDEAEVLFTLRAERSNVGA